MAEDLEYRTLRELAFDYRNTTDQILLNKIAAELDRRDALVTNQLSDSKSEANTRQPGGTHYIKYADFQPWDVCARFGLGFFDGNAVKYLLRWKDKGGIGDLEKARHYIDKLIEIIKQDTTNNKKEV